MGIFFSGAYAMNRFVRYLLMACGLLSLLLGIIGIFLPVLPTTPFLLLSSYCFYKSSVRLHHWLHHHRILGPYITSYMKYRAIKRKIKISSLLLLWTSLIISSLIVGKIYVTLILVIIGLAVSYHILSLRTLENLDRKLLTPKIRLSLINSRNIPDANTTKTVMT
jgi:uncharacterized protein